MNPRKQLLAPFLLIQFHPQLHPTATFLGVTFDRTLSFSKHESLLKAKFFLCLKALRCILLPHGAS